MIGTQKRIFPPNSARETAHQTAPLLPPREQTNPTQPNPIQPTTTSFAQRSPVRLEIRRLVGRRRGPQRRAAAAGCRRGGRLRGRQRRGHGRRPRQRVPDNLRRVLLLELLPAAALGEHRVVEAASFLLAGPFLLNAAGRTRNQGRRRGALALAPAFALPPRRHRGPPRRQRERGVCERERGERSVHAERRGEWKGSARVLRKQQ
jgi:hypothetical protein